MHPLNQFIASRDNNYNLLRLIAALAVIVDHSFDIVHQETHGELWFDQIGSTLGGLGVDVFFVISGFLVTRSLARRSGALEFTVARVLRIFPGLFINLLFIACVLGPLLTTVSPTDYFAHPGVVWYVLSNLQMVALPYPVATLPGVTLVNASLWTLPVEACCYAVLLCSSVVVAYSRKRHPGRWIFIGVALVVAGLATYRYQQTAGFHLAWMFTSGALYYGLRRHVRLSARMASIGLALLLACIVDARLFQPALLLLGPYLVFCAAYLPTGRIRAFNRLGDYSYGTYIYGFPVQMAIAITVPGVSVIALTAIAIPITLAVAALSWYGVERPALRCVSDAVGGLRSFAGLATSTR